MRLVETSSSFNYPWSQTLQAVFQKYPNPHSTHVLSEDTLSRRVDAEGRLITVRMLVKTNPLPKWAEPLVPGVRKVVIVETSTVDLRNKTLATQTFNINLKKFMHCVEDVVYRSGDNKTTIAQRSNTVDSNVFGLNYAIQKFGAEKYKRNVAKTDRGILHVLAELFPRPSHPQPVTSSKTTLMEKANQAKQIIAEKKDQSKMTV